MSRSRRATFRVAPPDPRSKCTGVLFTFSPETGLEGGTFVGAGQRRKDTALLFRFAARDTLPANLVVRFRGEEAMLVDTTWITSTAAKAVEKLMSAIVAPANVFAERRRRIERLDVEAPERAPALAMCTLDERTDPAELDRRGNTAAAASVRVITQHLTFRVLLRASWSLDHREFEPPVRLDEQCRHHGIAAETLFRTALIQAFPRPGASRGLDLRAFQSTFARFVAGELALGVLDPRKGPDPLACHGVPDGIRYLCFGEAALYFLRLRLHPDFWVDALRTFVCTAAVFTSCYWDGRNRTVKGYSWSRLHDAPPSASILATLRQRHAAMALPELVHDFGRIAALALRDDPSITRPGPTPLELR